MEIVDARAIGPRIRMMMPTLTPLEARVAEGALDRRRFGAETSIKAFAEGAGVSEAMVVKTCKKLGFPGFRAFRSALAEYNRLPTAEMHEELSPDDSGPEIVAKVFRTAMQALEETRAILDMKAFEAAADLMFRARQRDFYGVGGSAHIARDAAHKFLRIGLRASAFDDAHVMLMSAALLDREDVAVGFSHSGRSTAVLEAVALAKRNGAKTIAVTNYPASPLVDLADVVLLSTARGSPLMGENAAARIAQLNLLDAVFVAVAQRDYEAAERNLAKTMAAVQFKRKG